VSVQRKIYFPDTGAPSVSPAYDSGWDDTSSATRVLAAWDTYGSGSFATSTVSPASYPAGAGYHSVLIRQYVTPPFIDSWASATAFTLNQVIVDASNHVQRVTAAGTSGGSSPSWVHGGGTTTDGTVVWTDCGTDLYSPALSFAGSCVLRMSGTFSPAGSGAALNSIVAAGCLKLFDSTNTLKKRLSASTLPNFQLATALTSLAATIQLGSGPATLAAGDYFVIEVGFATYNGTGSPITSASASADFGSAASFDLLSSGDTRQGNPVQTVTLQSSLGPVSTPPYIAGAWVITQEPGGVGYVDQSARLHIPSGSSFSTLLRQRGTAEVTFRGAASDSYEPTLGMPIWLYDVQSDGTSTLVFSGTIDEITHTGAGTRGDRFAKLSCVSLEQVFDAILVPPRAYQNQTAGYIVSDLLTLCAGCPVTLGTVGAGATIANLTCDYESVAAIFDKMATASRYVWGVDQQTQTLYFRDAATNAAPFTFTSGILRYGSYDRKVSRKDFRDRQIVRLSPDAFAHSSELFTGTNSPPQTVTVRNPIKEIVNVWTTKNTQNTATATFSGQPSANDTITVTYPVAGSTYNWAATSPYTAGQIIIDPTNHIQRVTTGGTSGGSTPSFNHAGSTTVDGSVIWTDAGVNGAGGTGSSVYTFVATLDNTQFGQVLIGASTAATCQNLIDALNSTDAKKGVTFSLPTWENPLVNADAISGTHFTVRNKSAGAGYVAALAKSCANFTWSNSTTTGGGTTFGTVSLNVAVEGTSNTANAYYTPGQRSVKIIPAVDGSTYIQVEYTRIGGDTVIVEDSALVAARAVIENGTGKYQVETSDTEQTSNTAGLAEAQATLTAYKALPTELTLTTYQPGLMPGQTLTVALDATAQPVIASLMNGSYVVQEVSGQLVPTADYVGPNGHYEYTVRVIDQAQVGTWLDFWQGLSSGGGGGGGSLVAGSGTSGLSGVASGVTSVAVSAPSEISVSGSPITASGTVTLAWANAAANTALCGPSSGGAGTPAFRAIVPADIANKQGLAASKIQMSKTSATGQVAFYASDGDLEPKSVQGNNLKPQMAKGSYTSGNLTKYDVDGNLVDAGVSSTLPTTILVRDQTNTSDYTASKLRFTVGSNAGLSINNSSGTVTVDISLSGVCLDANNLSDLTSAGAARGNLGLGSAATHDVGDFVAAGYSFTVYGSDFNDSLGLPCSGSAVIYL